MPEWLTEAVLLSIIGGVFALLTAIVTKLSFDVSKTSKDTAAVHQSINNRPTSLSDRVDDVGTAASDALDAVNEIATTLKAHGQKLDTHSKDLRGIDESVGILRSADRDLQKGLAHTLREFSLHVMETGPMKEKIHRLAEKFLKD
ncbi:hypothetical protein ACT3UD_18205 [Glutamicibacter sp. 287]|uniref:hypothetical protein n=1 Tax=unclassified Glutamicibacter TaxID=2627139 RepID=UPI0040339408